MKPFKIFLFSFLITAPILCMQERCIDLRLLEEIKDGNDDPLVIQELMKQGANIHAFSEKFLDTNALFLAACLKKPKICRFLIAHGVDVNVCDNCGQTALMHASTCSNNQEICQMLIEAGADVNKINNNGWTALMLGVAKGNADVLLAAGADPNAQTRDGRTTALFYAAMFSHVSGCEHLLQYGANPEQENINGERAIKYASHRKRESERVKELLNDTEKTVEVIMRDDNPNPIMKRLRKTDANIAQSLMNRELGLK